MTDRYRRYAAIVFDGSSNLQFNYEGMHQTVLREFETNCKNREAAWGRLLDWRTGELAASFSKENGLELTADNPISGAPLADVLEDYYSDHYQAKIAAALCAGIREIEFSPAQYAHLTKHLAELGPTFLPPQSPAKPAGPGGMG
jgi:hypothetical protein